MKNGRFPSIYRGRRRRVRNHMLRPHDKIIELRDERVDILVKELGNAPQMLVGRLA